MVFMICTVYITCILVVLVVTSPVLKVSCDRYDIWLVLDWRFLCKSSKFVVMSQAAHACWVLGPKAAT